MNTDGQNLNTPLLRNWMCLQIDERLRAGLEENVQAAGHETTEFS